VKCAAHLTLISIVFEILKVNLSRPFVLAFTEPILWFWNAYISVCKHSSSPLVDSWLFAALAFADIRLLRLFMASFTYVLWLIHSSIRASVDGHSASRVLLSSELELVL
jgi:hypothetical protein